MSSELPLAYNSNAGLNYTRERFWTLLCLSFTHMLFKLVLKLLSTPACKLFPLVLLCNNSVRIVASLRLKNERGERLSFHRSDHVTGVWEDCTICAMFKEFFLTWVFCKFNSAPNPPTPSFQLL